MVFVICILVVVSGAVSNNSVVVSSASSRKTVLVSYSASKVVVLGASVVVVLKNFFKDIFVLCAM